MPSPRSLLFFFFAATAVSAVAASTKPPAPDRRVTLVEVELLRRLGRSRLGSLVKALVQQYRCGRALANLEGALRRPLWRRSSFIPGVAGQVGKNTVVSSSLCAVGFVPGLPGC